MAIAAKVTKPSLEDLIVDEATVGGSVLEPGLIANMADEDYDWAALKERCRDRIVDFYKGVDGKQVLPADTMKFIENELNMWCRRDLCVFGKLENEYDEAMMSGFDFNPLERMELIDQIAGKRIEQKPDDIGIVKDWIGSMCSRENLNARASEVFRKTSSMEAATKGPKGQGLKMK